MARRRNARHQLTPDQVLAIRELAAQGVSKADIAARYGCGSDNIRLIVMGRTWKNLPSAATS